MDAFDFLEIVLVRRHFCRVKVLEIGEHLLTSKCSFLVHFDEIARVAVQNIQNLLQIWLQNTPKLLVFVFFGIQVVPVYDRLYPEWFFLKPLQECVFDHNSELFSFFVDCW